MIDTFILYKVTGKLRNGKRFKTMYYSNAIDASRINLWHGSVYGILESGKCKLIKRV
jgi:hypothetical protein